MTRIALFNSETILWSEDHCSSHVTDEATGLLVHKSLAQRLRADEWWNQIQIQTHLIPNPTLCSPMTLAEARESTPPQEEHVFIIPTSRRASQSISACWRAAWAIPTPANVRGFAHSKKRSGPRWESSQQLPLDNSHSSLTPLKLTGAFLLFYRWKIRETLKDWKVFPKSCEPKGQLNGGGGGRRGRWGAGREAAEKYLWHQGE